MGVDKESSRNGGGYVGGFFQLFDWTAKSRKKLCSSKSEQSKQGKRSDGNLTMTQFHLTDEDEIEATSIKGSTDYSCASSITDDDVFGAKAPSVVARLMGLDSLPTYTEPYSTPLFDTQSLRDAHIRNRKLSYHHDQLVVYPGDLFSKIEGPARNFVESKPQKTVSKPIEKFQMESLPPKSAKTIPVTHHKLLSPIKSPGFISTKNAAHIMETAARIIQPSPQAIAKDKMPMVGSSSVPVKVRDFKERMEAVQKMPPVGSSSLSLKARDLKEKAETTHKTSRLTESTRRPAESNAAKYLKGQTLNKSWNGFTETTSPRTSDTEEISSALKSKGKSVSLAIQAKFNVQKREGLASSSTRSLLGPKDQSDVVCSQPFKSQLSTQKTSHKKPSMQNSSGVLKQNNQMQNSIADKEKLPSKPTCSNLRSRKVLSDDSAFGQHRMSGKAAGNSKTGLRKSSLVTSTMDGEKEGPYSCTKNPRKKRSIDRDIHFEKNQVVDSVLIEKKQKEDHPVNERSFSWVEDSKNKGMDVVSFTFTTPLTRPMEISAQVAEKNRGFCMDNRGKRLLLDTDSMKLSSSGYNVIGGDALSKLLEQKLRELTIAVESSSQKSLNSGSASGSISFSQDMGHSTPNACSSLPKLHDKLGSCYSSNLYSADLQLLRLKQKLQGGADECSSSSLDAVQPSPVSILEPSFSIESCNSSDSTDSFSIEESKQCSFVQSREVLGLSALKKLLPVEADTELSDSASSMYSRTVAKSNENFVSVKSANWELEYVNLILCNMELMFKDFALNRACETINPRLFDQLESRRGGFRSDGGGESRLERKVLFDSVSECIDLRCRQYVGGGYKMWTKGMMILRRNERLAEEVYNEICRWRGMGDCMVDELVDKDMSSQHGKWLDFEVDALVLGVDIEGQILNALVDEVITEFS
ncbi:protein FAR1-RELATED SEQUENCE 11-like [Hibiscus syriacus]|uniref:Protein FAR1-RELATED SEQUENCE 11-like n=1 Tax=Hibiscus syriacus TaxID=106335 RepID=A0A6A3AY73_HIBSY|nr:protein FAR1-RELATED SEQUENCE 11-like [Hibiscus syriacus]